jgi:hypothetical protein
MFVVSSKVVCVTDIRCDMELDVKVKPSMVEDSTLKKNAFLN